MAKIQCPNCMAEADRQGSKITCVSCNSVFKVTKTGEAKVDELGWKEELEKRVKAIEEQQAELLGGGDDPDSDDPGDNDEPILPE